MTIRITKQPSTACGLKTLGAVKVTGAVKAFGAVSLFALFTTPALAATDCGQASWYALNSKTASGEMMNPSAYTAAHKTLPFGTKVTVTNRNNGRSVTVRINDRGPFTKGRVIDLSKAAASQIGMIRSGHAPVCFKKAG